MTHRAQQIVEAVAAALSASSELAAAVFVHRRLSLAEGAQELPAASVGFGEDQPLSDLGVTNVAFIDSLLSVTVTVAARADDEEGLRAELLRLRVAVHKALMADSSLGLSFVIDTRYGGASAPDVDVSLDRPAGTLACIWAVHYRMNLSDPS